MLVRELIKKFKEMWLPVDELLLLDKNQKVERGMLRDSLMAYDSMPLWSVRGIGPVKAMELWKLGVRPGNLKKHLRLLPDVTRTALQYAPLDRIPHDLVTDIAQDFVGNTRCTIVGSYRRNSQTSGDVDILYTGELQRFASKLLAMHGDKWVPTSQGPSKISGIYRWKPDTAVAVDIWVATPSNKAAMLLYSTGSRDHNIRMRYIAKHRGYKLNQYGLWNGDQVIPTKTEREIFTLLKMAYVPPTKR